MKTTLACVFPETLPDAGLLFPLVQVFGQVVHMQAVENEPIETDSVFVRHCLDQGRLQTFTPAPLGDQRQRFMALVEDMRRHGADYTSQLSMLTLADLHRGNEQRESRHTLMSDLLRRTDIREKEADQLQLWQSRLMLKLGEWYDLQQADIDNALDRIVSRQGALLQELREEEDNPFNLTANLGESSRETENLLRHRLRAWCRLCFHAQAEAPGMLVTRHDTAFDLLQEMYEKQHGQVAQTLVSMELAMGDDLLAAVPLIEQIPALPGVIEQLLQPVAPEQATTIVRQWQAVQDTWEQLLAGEYPHAGRCRLDLVYFTGISASRLMLEGFAGGMRTGGQEKNEAEQGCCLGVLRMP